MLEPKESHDRKHRPLGRRSSPAAHTELQGRYRLQQDHNWRCLAEAGAVQHRCGVDMTTKKCLVANARDDEILDRSREKESNVRDAAWLVWRPLARVSRALSVQESQKCEDRRLVAPQRAAEGCRSDASSRCRSRLVGEASRTAFRTEKNFPDS